MMQDATPDDPRLDRGPDAHASGSDGPGSWDEALVRLEDVLLSMSYDRALPDLGEILDRAGVPMSFIQQDERALKLIREAMLARPFAEADAVRRSRAHVEMMMLEVEVLTERLRDDSTPQDVSARAMERLREIQKDLERLRDDL